MAIESYTSNPGNRIYLVRVGDKTRRCGSIDEAVYWESRYKREQSKAETAGMKRDPKAIDRFLGR